mmetsp:Transcript_4511/g.6792  ORF Transcript_4511/g.6792 Transcript_4511/m.6792 type:complete len:271 (-) Transcript_4511:23-835(-)
MGLLLVELGAVLHLLEIVLAEDSVVINGHFRVGGEDLVVLGEDERVDLDHVAVLLHEAIVHRLHQPHQLGLLLRDSKVVGSLNQGFHIWALEGVHVKLIDLAGVLLSDVLNRHSSGGRVDENGSRGGSIQGQTEVHFLLDAELLDNVDRVHEEAIGGLLGNEVVSEELASDMLGLLGVTTDLNSTLVASLLDVAHASSSTEDLGLDHAAIVELLGDIEGLSLGESDVSDGDGHLVGVEDVSSLVLVELEASGGGGDHLGEVEQALAGSSL